MERAEPAVEVVECRQRASAPNGSEELLAEYRREMLVAIDKIRLMHRRDFYDELHARIDSNFKCWKKQGYSAFVYLIAFKIDNVDEIAGLSMFEEGDDSESSRCNLQLSRLPTAEAYFHAVLAAVPEGRSIDRLIVFFRDRMDLPSDQLEALVTSLMHRLQRDHPKLRAALAFCVLQTSRYTFCSKRLHVEEFPFCANQKLALQVLCQFVKRSHLPWPVLGPNGLAGLLRSLEEYCVPVETSVRQWLTVGELAMLSLDKGLRRVHDELAKSGEAKRLTERYKLGLRLLRQALKQLYPQRSEVEKLWLDAFCSHAGLPANPFRAQPALETNFHHNIRAYLNSSKFSELLSKDEQLRQAVAQYSAERTLPSGGSSAAVLDMINTRRSGAPERVRASAPLELFNALVKLCFNDYFQFVSRNYPKLLINGAEEGEAQLNPDLRGELYLALGSREGERQLDGLTSAFFKALCTAPSKGLPSSLFELFHAELQLSETPLPSQRQLESVFLYQLCVFEHIGLLRLDRRKCRFEKFVFKKFA